MAKRRATTTTAKLSIPSDAPSSGILARVVNGSWENLVVIIHDTGDLFPLHIFVPGLLLQVLELTHCPTVVPGCISVSNNNLIRFCDLQLFLDLTMKPPVDNLSCMLD
jgi:hypothetical protein